MPDTAITRPTRPAPVTTGMRLGDALARPRSISTVRSKFDGDVDTTRAATVGMFSTNSRFSSSSSCLELAVGVVARGRRWLASLGELRAQPGVLGLEVAVVEHALKKSPTGEKTVSAAACTEPKASLRRAPIESITPPLPAVVEGDDRDRREDQQEERERGASGAAVHGHDAGGCLATARCVGDQDLLEGLELLEALADPIGDRVQRVLGDDDRHAGLAPTAVHRSRAAARRRR